MAREIGSLMVFQRAYDASLDIHRASQSFPKTEQFGGLADQLRRSSKSVCALLVEGAGRQGEDDIEFRRYVRMALGSVEETRLWCRYAQDLGFVLPETAAVFEATYVEIARMLQGLLKRLSVRC